MEIEQLGIGGNTGDLAAGLKRLQWRPSDRLVETLRLGIRDNSGDLVALEWRGHWRLSGLGLEVTVDT